MHSLPFVKRIEGNVMVHPLFRFTKCTEGNKSQSGVIDRSERKYISSVKKKEKKRN